MSFNILTVVSSHLSNESSISSISATLNIQIETVNNGIVERTQATAAISEKTPDLVGIALCLRVIGESVSSDSTTFARAYIISNKI